MDGPTVDEVRQDLAKRYALEAGIVIGELARLITAMRTHEEYIAMRDGFMSRVSLQTNEVDRTIRLICRRTYYDIIRVYLTATGLRFEGTNEAHASFLVHAE